MTKQIKRARPQPQWKRWVEPALVIVVVCLLSVATSLGTTRLQREGELRIWFFDIGQGDAALVLLPTGEQLLIDAGRDNRVLSKLGAVLPPWDRSLDTIILTHPDADHITGFVDVLERYEVAEIITTGASAYTPVMQTLEDQFVREQGYIRHVSQGERLTYGDVVIDVLWPEETLTGEVPEDRNNSSLVLRLVYKETSILFTGDAEQEAEEGFGSLVGDIDVLTVGHHGSLTSSTVEFLDQVDPEKATISVGIDNGYGHPHPVVLKRLEGSGVQVFRTDQDGDLFLTSEGGEPELTPHPLPF